jgi:hypothetical protein
MVKIWKTTAGVCALSTLLGVAGLATPSLAKKPAPITNAYEACGVSLNRATIAADVAAKSCAEVLYPVELGQCISSITGLKADATETLTACRMVRRPLELATCVADIHKQDKAIAVGDVLQFCRRSLLPERYGSCVVGLNQKPLAIATKDSLSTCIDASDRPVEVLPTFIPIERLSTIRNFMRIPSTPNPATTEASPETVSPGAATPETVLPQMF